jgi:hypothetical protein
MQNCNCPIDANHHRMAIIENAFNQIQQLDHSVICDLLKAGDEVRDDANRQAIIEKGFHQIQLEAEVSKSCILDAFGIICDQYQAMNCWMDCKDRFLQRFLQQEIQVLQQIQLEALKLEAEVQIAFAAMNM